MPPATRELAATNGNTLIVIGAQLARFTAQFVDELRNGLESGPDYIRQTLAGLPGLWDALIAEVPEIQQHVLGREVFEDPLKYLEEALKMEKTVPLPNMILSPMVVAHTFLQHWQYLVLANNTEVQDGEAQMDLQAEWLAKRANSKLATLGFCGGILSAFAMASSSNQEQLERYSAAAIRLSMTMGAMLDADEVQNGETKALVTMCREEKHLTDLPRIVEELSPHAHIQANFDMGVTTVCVSESKASLLIERLNAAGLKCSRLDNIHGRAHDSSERSHRSADLVIELCNKLPGLQLPDASELVIETYTNTGEATPISQGRLHEIAVHCVFTRPCHWHQSFAAVHSTLQDPVVVSFGPEQCVPRSVIHDIRPNLVNMVDIYHAATTSRVRNERRAAPITPPAPSTTTTTSPSPTPTSSISTPPTTASSPVSIHSAEKFSPGNASEHIAIVGMALRVAGADDIDQFAELLRTGQSQHRRVSPDRIVFQGADDNEWYANLMQDVGCFDHKFFKRSPRESAAIDPQQRLFLQTVYQALENAGYFASAVRTGEARKDVGIHVGCTMNDYEHHGAGNSPSAFTATATKSYIGARAAHFFGWTGPAIVYDTTCSSSMVALHAACRSLLMGESSTAVSGGVNIMTHPHIFRALKAGNFISPTGQCKPFDSKADGYCRAEASGCVVLKRMSDAVRDGDRILGSIEATAVLQNQDITPFFVPNPPSLTQLFTTVFQKAGISPCQINLMEAHGTGTVIGDAAEYHSIREILAGPGRKKPLLLGSVKGHVGHAEGTSGIVALVKVLTMMQENFIPPQASFSKLSPHLNASANDMIEVPTALREWPKGPRTAFISNYGATGSNAAMIVTHPGNSCEPHGYPAQGPANHGAEPFWIAGLDKRSIVAYCARLKTYLQSHPTASLADVAFNLSQQSNRNLPQRLLLRCNSTEQLERLLVQVTSDVTGTKIGEPSEITFLENKHSPVIICFGGQTGNCINLQREVYDRMKIFRYHLDACDSAIQATGCGSIYPGIFSSEPISDQVQLQAMLFAVQYTCARSWLDCGLRKRVAAVIGHSFGDITALCISGALPFHDAIQLVVDRARLVRDGWGVDPGAMMTIDAEESIVHKILANANAQRNEEEGQHDANIACYNGPTNFTVAGSTDAIERVMAVCQGLPEVKVQRLNVTNAFHSSLTETETLRNQLQERSRELALKLKPPGIRHERATECPKSTPFDAWEHIREPVYFSHAVQRLTKEFPSCSWLEAGSASGVTTMVRQALGGTTGSHTFHSMNISGKKKDGVLETTLSLWKKSIPATFWAHHPSQSSERALLSLPPYQFEKSHHWLPLRLPPTKGEEQKPSEKETLRDLFTFSGYRDGVALGKDGKGKQPSFLINTESAQYRKYVQGHCMNQTAPVCPVPLQMGLAIAALASLHPHWEKGRLQPALMNLTNHHPVCIDPSRRFWLEFSAVDDGDDTQPTWDWTLTSTRTSPTSTGNTPMVHLEARLKMYRPGDVAYEAEFRLLQQMVSHAQCTALLKLGSADDDAHSDIHIVQGSTVYRAIENVVDYGEMYRWVRRVVARGNEAAGSVHKKEDQGSWVDVALSDSFAQVGALLVNCMSDHDPSEIYMVRGCDRWIRSPTYTGSPDSWHVFVRRWKDSDETEKTDLFIFDPTTGELAQAILGSRHWCISKAGLGQILRRFTTDPSVIRNVGHTTPTHQHEESVRYSERKAEPESTSKAPSPTERFDVLGMMSTLVAELLGIDVSEIAPESNLADLGVDSLMSMELMQEIEKLFKCMPDQADLMEAETLQDLSACIMSTLYPDDDTNSTQLAKDIPLEDTPPLKAPTIQDIREEETSSERQLKAQGYVTQYAAGFHHEPVLSGSPQNESQKDPEPGAVVIVTGASGSLGCHLAAHLARSSSVRNVVCINRPKRGTSAMARQLEVFSSWGIDLPTPALNKVRAFEAKTWERHLALPDDDYTWLVENGTHIVHCAFSLNPMQPLRGFERQFQAMRQLINLGSEIVTRRAQVTFRLGFQFVSSLGVVGEGQKGLAMPEELQEMDVVQPLGYHEAKWVCEHMLEQTLRRYPDSFKAMSVRLGQVSGSSVTGKWNTGEHFPFLVKSAQTLRAWPDLGGRVVWVPVDKVASTMSDLLGLESSHIAQVVNSVYHIENQKGRPWSEHSPVVAAALGIPPENIIPFKDWLQRVRESPLDPMKENPAFGFADYLEQRYERIMCGGILDTAQTRAGSETMASLESIGDDLMTRYIDAWKEEGFLSS